MNVCHPCYQLSSLLPLAGNRDDIKYENSHLLCCLEVKFENVYTKVFMPIMLFLCLDLFYSQQIIFSKKLVTGFTGCHSCYQMSSLLPVMFAQNIKLPNTLLLHSFTGLKVGVCRYILQKMKIHSLQYPKEYLILCV